MRVFDAVYSVSLVLFFLIYQGAELCKPTLCAASMVSEGSIEDPEVGRDVRDLVVWNGRVIQEIQVQALKRTHEFAVRWYLRPSEGKPFNSETWKRSLLDLYNTYAVFDLRTEIQAVDNDPKGPIRIKLLITDRWTFIPGPIGGVGGGLNNYGFTIQDYNTLGFLTNSLVTLQWFNEQLSYDVTVSQDRVGKTGMLAGIDIFSNIYPVADASGVNGANFTWQRNHQMILVGTRFGDETVRLLTYWEHLKDQMLLQSGGSATYVFSGDQYRFRPVIQVGHINQLNYLEKGAELFIYPVLANIFGPAPSYYQLTLNFQHVMITPKSDHTFAYLLSANGSSTVPQPYQFHLGGFDSIRGYGAFRALGQYMVFGNFEFRPHLFDFRTSFMGIDQFASQFCIFSDIGQSFGAADPSGNGPLNVSQFLWSTGAGVRFFFTGYAGAVMRLDVARTLVPYEGFAFSASVTGQFFDLQQPQTSP